jgi:hypothetical protein
VHILEKCTPPILLDLHVKESLMTFRLMEVIFSEWLYNKLLCSASFLAISRGLELTAFQRNMMSVAARASEKEIFYVKVPCHGNRHPRALFHMQ